MKEPCPFKVGDMVYYRPSVRGHEQSAMQIPKGVPEVGQAVTITKIIDGKYVIYEGYAHRTGGIYWNEFSPI